MTDTDRIEALAAQYTAAMPDLDPSLQRAALVLLRLLAQGEPVEVQRLADASGHPADFVEAALDAAPGIFRDDRRRVTGALGLSVVEVGHHRLHVDGRTLSARCAWDTLFLPELLGVTAGVTSRCPVTGAEISLTVTPAGPAGLSPAGTVISYLVPEEKFDVDVVESFCDFVYFFASAQAAGQWTAGHPGTFPLSVDDAYRLGQLTNRASFGAGLDAMSGAGTAWPGGNAVGNGETMEQA
jgi:alkylmercury lyase